MSWRERLRRPTRVNKSTSPAISRTFFVIIERRDLNPRGSALLAQLTRYYTVTPTASRQRYSFRVEVSDVEPGRDPTEHLATVLTEIDPEWEEHFTWPLVAPRSD